MISDFQAVRENLFPASHGAIEGRRRARPQRGQELKTSTDPLPIVPHSKGV